MSFATFSPIRRLQPTRKTNSLASGWELVKRVHKLQARIDQQEERLAQLEADLVISRLGEGAANELAESLNRMEHATRRALRNLYDPGRLAGGDLTCLLTEVSGCPIDLRVVRIVKKLSESRIWQITG